MTSSSPDRKRQNRRGRDSSLEAADLTQHRCAKRDIRSREPLACFERTGFFSVIHDREKSALPFVEPFRSLARPNRLYRPARNARFFMRVEYGRDRIRPTRHRNGVIIDIGDDRRARLAKRRIARARQTGDFVYDQARIRRQTVVFPEIFLCGVDRLEFVDDEYLKRICVHGLCISVA